MFFYPRNLIGQNGYHGDTPLVDIVGGGVTIGQMMDHHVELGYHLDSDMHTWSSLFCENVFLTPCNQTLNQASKQTSKQTNAFLSYDPPYSRKNNGHVRSMVGLHL